MTSDQPILRVQARSYSYPMLIGDGALNRISEFTNQLKILKPDRQHVIVAESHVASLYLQKLTDVLVQCGLKPSHIVVKASEESKVLTGVADICQKILATGLRRDGVVWALGGGVLGDMAGFAAAISLRGLDYVQVPTTLLAQVDSSVGGKTGVNTAEGKNLLGAFHPPRLVVADTGMLASLDEKNLKSGYAELVKHAVIADQAFFDDLDQGAMVDLLSLPSRRWTAAIYQSVAIKAQVVSEDEKEAGKRQLLNFGHTFGHALERLCDYNADILPHGYAVSIGMILAAELSSKLGLCPPATVTRLARHLEQRGLPTSPKILGSRISIQVMFDAMQFDKKRVDSGLVFITLRDLGHASITKLNDLSMVRQVLQTMIQTSS